MDYGQTLSRCIEMDFLQKQATLYHNMSLRSRKSSIDSVLTSPVSPHSDFSDAASGISRISGVSGHSTSGIRYSSSRSIRFNVSISTPDSPPASEPASPSHAGSEGLSSKPGVVPTRLHDSTETGTSDEVEDRKDVCYWKGCHQHIKGEMLEHVCATHVMPQVAQKSRRKRHGSGFACMWDTCKVRGKASISFAWLERHVHAHCGNRPVRCIIKGCPERFRSNDLLSRHIEAAHFQDPVDNSPGQSPGTPTKKKRRVQPRRQDINCPVTGPDFLTPDVFEYMECFLKRFESNLDDPERGIKVFQGHIRARETSVVDGKVHKRYYLEYTPGGCLDPVWVSEEKLEESLRRELTVSQMPGHYVKFLCDYNRELSGKEVEKVEMHFQVFEQFHSTKIGYL